MQTRFKKGRATKMIYYHLTKKSNLINIARNGLRPQCGEQSKTIEDARKAVFLYKNLRETCNWHNKLYYGTPFRQINDFRRGLKKPPTVTIIPPKVLYEDLALLNITTDEQLLVDEKNKTDASSFFTTERIKASNIEIVREIFIPAKKIKFSLETYSKDREKYIKKPNQEYGVLFELCDKGFEYETSPIKELLK